MSSVMPRVGCAHRRLSWVAAGEAEPPYCLPQPAPGVAASGAWGVLMCFSMLLIHMRRGSGFPASGRLCLGFLKEKGIEKRETPPPPPSSFILRGDSWRRMTVGLRSAEEHNGPWQHLQMCQSHQSLTRWSLVSQLQHSPQPQTWPSCRNQYQYMTQGAFLTSRNYSKNLTLGTTLGECCRKRSKSNEGYFPVTLREQKLRSKLTGFRKMHYFLHS